MTIIGITIDLLIFIFGIIAIIFSRTIANTTYVDWFSGLNPSNIIANIVNYIRRRKKSDTDREFHETNGEEIYMWALRIFGAWAILLSIFGFYIILSDS